MTTKLWIARLKGDSRAWAATNPETGAVACTLDPLTAISDPSVEGLKAKLGDAVRDFIPSLLTYEVGRKEVRWPE